MKKLVIVESPTKAKTISGFVGKKYAIESSFGHVRDLPKSKLGIDLENNFEPHYIIPKKIQSRVTALRKLAAKADEVILATDEDREGEAIAWHLIEALKLKNSTETPIKRIVFHEITKNAIEKALESPRNIDLNLVNAQQGRRVLDRLVGYELSPFLWKKVVRGLSAGRVQSAALRIIMEREEEIEKFKPEEYWSITAALKTKKQEIFEADLSKIENEAIGKLGIKNQAQVDAIVEDLESATYSVASVEKTETRKNPYPPFITSTLQQTAARHFGFSSKKTMFLAQGLYENGHITYMRTDSVNLSAESLSAAKSWIESNLPAEYNIGPIHYKSKSRLAQEAHEAIRPTNPQNTPDSLGGEKLEKDARRLYDLIWRRFMASQLPPAVLDALKIEVGALSKNKKHYLFSATGSTLKFDGFMKIWTTKLEERELPSVQNGDPLEAESVTPTQHFTEPPARYNEASLIKIMERHGIGRPSTYAPTISVIQARNYVEKIQGRFHPTEIGKLVDTVLKENFPEIVNVEFTANMEESLDKIAEGTEEWQKVIGNFYGPFAKNLKERYATVEKQGVAEEKTGIACELCGKEMIIKFGRFGKFMACSGFPDCKNAKPIKEPPKLIGLKCPKCTEGDVIEKRVNRKGRARGKVFWGCNRYPKCDYASWKNPLDPEGLEEKTKPKTEEPQEKENLDKEEE